MAALWASGRTSGIGTPAPGRCLPSSVSEPPGWADAVADAADGHDPRSGHGGHPVEQETGPGEVPEVVGAELQLEAVGRRPTGRVHDTGVVDQQVDPPVATAESLGRDPDRIERRQIEMLELELGPRHRCGDVVEGGAAPVEVAHGHHHGGAVSGQPAGGLEPQPGVGAGHDRDPAPLVGDVGLGPRSARHPHAPWVDRRRP
jgi:hypothetical protein